MELDFPDFGSPEMAVSVSRGALAKPTMQGDTVATKALESFTSWRRDRDARGERSLPQEAALAKELEDEEEKEHEEHLLVQSRSTSSVLTSPAEINRPTALLLEQQTSSRSLCDNALLSPSSTVMTPSGMPRTLVTTSAGSLSKRRAEGNSRAASLTKKQTKRKQEDDDLALVMDSAARSQKKWPVSSQKPPPEERVALESRFSQWLREDSEAPRKQLLRRDSDADGFLGEGVGEGSYVEGHISSEMQSRLSNVLFPQEEKHDEMVVSSPSRSSMWEEKHDERISSPTDRSSRRSRGSSSTVALVRSLDEDQQPERVVSTLAAPLTAEDVFCDPAAKFGARGVAATMNGNVATGDLRLEAMARGAEWERRQGEATEKLGQVGEAYRHFGKAAEMMRECEKEAILASMEDKSTTLALRGASRVDLERSVMVYSDEVVDAAFIVQAGWRLHLAVISMRFTLFKAHWRGATLRRMLAPIRHDAAAVMMQRLVRWWLRERERAALRIQTYYRDRVIHRAYAERVIARRMRAVMLHHGWRLQRWLRRARLRLRQAAALKFQRAWRKIAAIMDVLKKKRMRRRALATKITAFVRGRILGPLVVAAACRLRLEEHADQLKEEHQTLLGAYLLAKARRGKEPRCYTVPSYKHDDKAASSLAWRLQCLTTNKALPMVIPTSPLRKEAGDDEYFAASSFESKRSEEVVYEAGGLARRGVAFCRRRSSARFECPRCLCSFAFQGELARHFSPDGLCMGDEARGPFKPRSELLASPAEYAKIRATRRQLARWYDLREAVEQAERHARCAAWLHPPHPADFKAVRRSLATRREEILARELRLLLLRKRHSTDIDYLEEDILVFVGASLLAHKRTSTLSLLDLGALFSALQNDDDPGRSCTNDNDVLMIMAPGTTKRWVRAEALALSCLDAIRSTRLHGDEEEAVDDEAFVHDAVPSASLVTLQEFHRWCISSSFPGASALDGRLLNDDLCLDVLARHVVARAESARASLNVLSTWVAAGVDEAARLLQAPGRVDDEDARLEKLGLDKLTSRGLETVAWAIEQADIKAHVILANLILLGSDEKKQGRKKKVKHHLRKAASTSASKKAKAAKIAPSRDKSPRVAPVPAKDDYSAMRAAFWGDGEEQPEEGEEKVEEEAEPPPAPTLKILPLERSNSMTPRMLGGVLWEEVSFKTAPFDWEKRRASLVEEAALDWRQRSGTVAGKSLMRQQMSKTRADAEELDGFDKISSSLTSLALLVKQENELQSKEQAKNLLPRFYALDWRYPRDKAALRSYGDHASFYAALAAARARCAETPKSAAFKAQRAPLERKLVELQRAVLFNDLCSLTDRDARLAERADPVKARARLDWERKYCASLRSRFQRQETPREEALSQAEYLAALYDVDGEDSIPLSLLPRLLQRFFNAPSVLAWTWAKDLICDEGATTFGRADLGHWLTTAADHYEDPLVISRLDQGWDETTNAGGCLPRRRRRRRRADFDAKERILVANHTRMLKATTTVFRMEQQEAAFLFPDPPKPSKNDLYLPVPEEEEFGPY